jgi:hypothetical protein
MSWYDDGSEEEHQGAQRRKAAQREVLARQARMRGIVAEFQKYVATYTEQAHYDDYLDNTYLNDMLYGIGISMGQEYVGAEGFQRFKRVLIEHLGS